MALFYHGIEAVSMKKTVLCRTAFSYTVI